MSGDISTTNFYGIPIRIPALGDYDLSPSRAMKIAECVVASGTTGGVPTASSDADADILMDTLLAEVFNVHCSSDKSQGVLVSKVVPVCITAFAASVTGGIGDTGDANGWFDDTLSSGGSWTTTGQYSGIIALGSDDVNIYAFTGGLHYHSSSGAIELTLAGANLTAGRLAIYAEYFVCGRGGGQ